MSETTGRISCPSIRPKKTTRHKNISGTGNDPLTSFSIGNAKYPTAETIPPYKIVTNIIAFDGVYNRIGHVCSHTHHPNIDPSNPKGTPRANSTRDQCSALVNWQQTITAITGGKTIARLIRSISPPRSRSAMIKKASRPESKKIARIFVIHIDVLFITIRICSPVFQRSQTEIARLAHLNRITTVVQLKGFVCFIHM